MSQPHRRGSAAIERFIAPRDTKRFFYLLTVGLEVLVAAVIGVALGLIIEGVLDIGITTAIIAVAQAMATAAVVYVTLVLLARTVRMLNSAF